eukprot:CAMPEP_0185031748 /NCGR_PEP_ID=MMETSP1103-20130426/19369_1 /TAXON_ID=36769 /ORGANISM="Paraphysomonas bandaiensis, Strain Caron Lab Isolate" /LENGTH=237 /DNA_ID=CAMNT_0027567371 /DNA_START=19 /DNA_END=729 /DNA_ORIENTATION=+
MSSNWASLKRKLNDTSDTKRVKDAPNKKRKRSDITDAVRLKQTIQSEGAGTCSMNGSAVPGDDLDATEKSKYIALDCEMVGIGSSGKRSALARCCLVDFDGNKIYDKFVRPKSFVTDFRTKYSGVRKSDLRKGVAVTLEECMQQVAALIHGKILVGHALHNDLDVLMLSHHRSQIRDTATYAPYMRAHGKAGGKMRPRSLRDLSKQFLGLTIQDGEHDPGIDAKSAMMLYRLKRDEW